MSNTSTNILRYFQVEHLTSETLRNVSEPFQTLAHLIANDLPDSAEKSTALRKLLEAKDAAVRSALDLTEG